MCLNAGPMALGMRGVGLIVAVIPATIVLAVVGLGFFPPGTYRRLFLALPGVIAGCLLSYGLGFSCTGFLRCWGICRAAWSGPSVRG